MLAKKKTYIPVSAPKITTENTVYLQLQNPKERITYNCDRSVFEYQEIPNVVEDLQWEAWMGSGGKDIRECSPIKFLELLVELANKTIGERRL